jgi:hypothetical protein
MAPGISELMGGWQGWCRVFRHLISCSRNGCLPRRARRARKRTGVSGSDIEARGVVSRKTGIDRRVVGFGGPQSSVRYKSSLEERVR